MGTLSLQGTKSGTLLHTREITASADVSDISGEAAGTHGLSGLLMRQGSPRVHPESCGRRHLLSLAELGGVGRAARLVWEHLTWGGRVRHHWGRVLLEETTEARQCALGGEGPSQINGGLFTEDIYPLRWRVFRVCFGGSAISTRPRPSLAFHVTVLTVPSPPLHRQRQEGRGSRGLHLLGSRPFQGVMPSPETSKRPSPCISLARAIFRRPTIRPRTKLAFLPRRNADWHLSKTTALARWGGAALAASTLGGHWERGLKGPRPRHAV